MLHRIKYEIFLPFLLIFACSDESQDQSETKIANLPESITNEELIDLANNPLLDTTRYSSDYGYSQSLRDLPVTPRNNVVGRWSGQFGWPLIPLHATLMPNGQVFTFGTNGQGAQGAYIYDVWTPGGGHQTFGTGQGNDVFCSATALQPNGEVLIAGGDRRNPVNLGINDSLIYRMGAGSLARTSYMQFARWYPTLTTLPNGEQLIHGGIDGGGAPIGPPEVYNGGWRTLFGANNGGIINGDEGKWFYPRNWVAPNGRIFGVTGNVMYFLDWGGGGGSQIVGNIPNKTRSHTSTAVMYAPGKILQVGGSTDGNTGGPGSNQAIRIDINSGGPQITNLPNMAWARIWGNSTVLPNGEVLITGGSARINEDFNSAKQAEMWNPDSLQFRRLATAATPRLYHSTSLLLPDASVLVAGGGAPGPFNNLNGEIYYPPYLFRADGSPRDRVSIGGFNTNQGYNNLVGVPFSGIGGVTRVSLIRLGSVTHSFDAGQRFIPLSFSVAGNTANVRMPPNPNIAPPGYYMLFLINNQDAPSVARIISLGKPGGGGGGPVAGQVYQLVARHSNKCVDVDGAGTANGTNIQQYTCNGTNAQKFRVQNAANGAFNLVNINSGKCIDVSNVATADGQNIHQWDCVGGANQAVRFGAATAGSFTVKFDHSGKCMDVAGVSAADRANIHQWTCLAGPGNQEWFFR